MVTEYGRCPAFGYECEYVAKVEAQAAEIERLREALDRNENTIINMGQKGHGTIDRLTAEIERLREALTLAANRMDVMALEVIHENSSRRYEWKEWAVAAREALAGKAEQ